MSEKTYNLSELPEFTWECLWDTLDSKWWNGTKVEPTMTWGEIITAFGNPNGSLLQWFDTPYVLSIGNMVVDESKWLLCHIGIVMQGCPFVFPFYIVLVPGEKDKAHVIWIRSKTFACSSLEILHYFMYGRYMPDSLIHDISGSQSISLKEFQNIVSEISVILTKWLMFPDKITIFDQYFQLFGMENVKIRGGYSQTKAKSTKEKEASVKRQHDLRSTFQKRYRARFEP